MAQKLLLDTADIIAASTVSPNRVLAHGYCSSRRWRTPVLLSRWRS